MSRRAVIYTRISKDREGAGLGVDRQEADCRELADRLGWQVVGHHPDNDLSAYTGKPRPGYRALLEDIKAGRADAVLVWHTDRLHRSPVELEAYIDICGDRVVTQTVKAGPVDLSTPSGRMVARQFGNLARYEVEHMIERAQRAKLQAATDGKWKGGRRPFGYESDGVTVRESEAVHIREAADALLAGMSLHAIARDLNARGVTTSTDGPWQPSQVRKLLMRPRNAAKMEHRGEVIGDAQWPAILDDEVWHAIRALCADPTRRTSTGNVRRWLGGQLYLCGVCGGRLRASSAGTGGKGRGHAPAYRCEHGKHVVRNAQNLDDFVSAVAIERLSRPDVDLATDAARPDTTTLHVERLAVQARLDGLVDSYTTGTITARQLERGTASLREQLDDLDRRVAATATTSALDGVTGPAAADIWPTLDLSRQRAIIDALMTVTVHRAARGRPPGWRAGRPYFDRRGIEITPKTA